MIYNTLDIIPARVFFKIAETENYKLLWSTGNPKLKDGVFDFQGIWEGLNEEYKEITGTVDSKRHFKTYRDIVKLETQYKTVQMCCQCLFYGDDEELEQILRDNGYPLGSNKEESLKNIMLGSERLLIKAKRLSTKLPKQSEVNVKTSIEEVIASYSQVLGFDLDFNMSVTEFLACKKQVENKIKAHKDNG